MVKKKLTACRSFCSLGLRTYRTSSPGGLTALPGHGLAHPGLVTPNRPPAILLNVFCPRQKSKVARSAVPAYTRYVLEMRRNRAHLRVPYRPPLVSEDF